MTDRAMVFVKGTATSTSFDAGISGAVFNGSPFAGTDLTVADENVTAFGFGAGVEVAVTDNAFARVDYDQLWYSDFEVDADFLLIEPNYKAITLSVGYRF